MGSNYEIAYNTEWNKLKQLSAIDISKRLEVKYNSEDKNIIIAFINKDYVLDYETNGIYREEDNFRPTIDDSIIILNYLTFSTERVITQNKWVTLKEIPNGGALFYPAFYKMTIKRIIETFGNNIKFFEKNAMKLGGTKTNFGDCAYIFKVFPKVSICVAIWEGDDEIAPNATILFDYSVQYLLHIETIIGVGMCLAQKLIAI
ncbi:MAG: DUF3786 domain-containing protein [Peptostreptococcaceae bacterium]